MTKLNLTTAIASIALATATFAAPLTAQAKDARNARVTTTASPVKTVRVQTTVSPVYSLNRGYTTTYSTIGFNPVYGHRVSSLDLQIAGLVRQLTKLKHTGRRSIGFKKRVRTLELRIADLRRQRLRSVKARNNAHKNINVRRVHFSF